MFIHLLQLKHVGHLEKGKEPVTLKSIVLGIILHMYANTFHLKGFSIILYSEGLKHRWSSAEKQVRDKSIRMKGV